MDMRMDRTRAVVAKTEDLDAEDGRYWAAASDMEKLQTITYLRECFYGPEATTGRLQRIYSIIEQE
jgi:hypothetical protein